MKSTHVKNETEEIEFPCLMKLEVSGAIILATGKNSNAYVGMTVNKTERYNVGEFEKCWSRDFKPLPKGEQIILEN